MKTTILNRKKDASRRSFIVGIIYAIPLLIGGTLTVSIGNYLLGRPKTMPDGWADAGDVSDSKAGVPRQVRFERVVIDGWQIRSRKSAAWVVVDEQQHITAFSPQCTHLGCAYKWQAEKKAFTCPCHGSVFNIQGNVIAGPATRPLDRYATKVEGHRLWLGPLQHESA